MNLIHHHLIYQARVTNSQLGFDSGRVLKQFLYDLIETIDMQCLIPAQVKLSYQKAWTGLVGIVTSHIAFHYWVEQRYIQLDIYSCKKFDHQKTLGFIKQFWRTQEEGILFIDREIDKKIKIVNFG